MHEIEFSTASLNIIANQLRSGTIAALPTDTIYGLHCIANDATAVARLLALKGRAPDKPCILLCGDLQMAMTFAHFSPLARHLAAQLRDQPVTFLLPRVQQSLTQYFPTCRELAVRVPQHDLLRKLVSCCNAPLLSTSVNRAGQQPLLTADEINRNFANPELLLGVEESPAPQAWPQPSTIVRIDGERVEVVRAGTVSGAQITELVAHFVQHND